MQSNGVKGSNLLDIRAVNERLVLHLVRVNGQLTKAEATRLTGLSANAVSVIFRALEGDGLVLRGNPNRGQIGQPSVPMRLNPNARFFIGFKIGRRSFDLVLINFLGEVLVRVTQKHLYPTPAAAMAFIETQLDGLLLQGGKSELDISAFSVAIPSELWSWTDEFGAPVEQLQAWQYFPIGNELEQRLPYPITIENDGTAACRAEWAFGPSHVVQDGIYFFVGTFIGGGLVLSGSVFPGRRGNAGGFGPLRVPGGVNADRLVDHASLSVLARRVAQRDPELSSLVQDEQADWLLLEPELQQWLDQASRSLAHAIVSSLAVIDFDTVIIDGAFPNDVRESLIEKVKVQLRNIDTQGVLIPELSAGHFGSVARALGAAGHTITRHYMIDQHTLLRVSKPISLAK